MSEVTMETTPRTTVVGGRPTRGDGPAGPPGGPGRDAGPARARP